jgi:hypothetical protein
VEVVGGSFANSPSQGGVKIANRDRVTGRDGIRLNMEPSDAAKLRTEESREIYRQRKKIVEPVFG